MTKSDGGADLTTMIAELEEAERAATPGPWSDHKPGMGACWIVDPDGDPLWIAPDGDPNTISYQDARLIALMRNHLPALIEAVKRQGEALEKIAKGKYGKCPIEGHWPPEKPCTLCGDLGFFDDEPQYNPAKDGHCVEGGARVIARVALKEPTDV